VAKKVLGWGALAFLVFYIVTQPAAAAGVFKAIGSGLASIANGFGSFVGNLT
jgi:hypothetical protein